MDCLACQSLLHHPSHFPSCWRQSHPSDWMARGDSMTLLGRAPLNCGEGQLVLHFWLPWIKQMEKIFSGCHGQPGPCSLGPIISPALIGGVVWGLDWRRPLPFCIQLIVNKAHPVCRSLLSSFWSFLGRPTAHEEQM